MSEPDDDIIKNAQPLMYDASEMNRQAQHDQAVQDLAVVKQHLAFQDAHLDQQDLKLDKLDDKMDRNLLTLSDRMQAYITADNADDATLATIMADKYAKKEDVIAVGNKIDGLLLKILGFFASAMLLMAGWIYYSLQHFPVSH